MVLGDDDDAEEQGGWNLTAVAVVVEAIVKANENTSEKKPVMNLIVRNTCVTIV